MINLGIKLYLLKHFRELLKNIKVERRGEDLAPLKPFGTPTDQQALAHERLQEVVEDALVRVSRG